MANYPTLAEMGVTNFEDILRYSLQTVNNVDILRIVYKRKKGSLLHISKKFRFGRAEKMVVTDSGKHETAVIHEISPFVSKAIDELQKLTSPENSKKAKKAVIADEIKRLEEDTSSRIAYIKSLLEDLD